MTALVHVVKCSVAGELSNNDRSDEEQKRTDLAPVGRLRDNVAWTPSDPQIDVLTAPGQGRALSSRTRARSSSPHGPPPSERPESHATGLRHPRRGIRHHRPPLGNRTVPAPAAGSGPAAGDRNLQSGRALLAVRGPGLRDVRAATDEGEGSVDEAGGEGNDPDEDLGGGGVGGDGGGGVRIIVIAGPNGAGKSTFAGEYLRREAGNPPFVNGDDIAAGLNPEDPAAAAQEAGRIALRRMEAYVSTGRDFAVETTLSGRAYARRIRRWREREGLPRRDRLPGAMLGRHPSACPATHCPARSEIPAAAWCATAPQDRGTNLRPTT